MGQAGLASAANITKPATVALVNIRATANKTDALLGPPSTFEEMTLSSVRSVCGTDDSVLIFPGAASRVG